MIISVMVKKIDRVCAGIFGYNEIKCFINNFSLKIKYENQIFIKRPSEGLL